MNAGWRQAGLCVLLLGLARAAAAETLRLEEIGAGPLPVPGVGNAELSGITWTGGARYLAVDDGRWRLVPLDVTLDPASGALASVVAGDVVPLKGAHDVEGVAWRPAQKSVLVTDEVTNEIREHDPVTGELRRSIPAPPPFRGQLSANRGFEGVAVSPDGAHVWTANEGPLRLDGEAPTALEGAWLRLQRFDAALAPDGQFAYRSEPGLGFVGVVDLLVTPAGRLLVLERALTGGGFSARIFAVDVAGATDVTGTPSLRDAEGVTPARKQKLWERAGGFQNFEGMTLGPELPGGGRLVLLVSDGGGQRQPALLALRLTSAPSQPPAR